MIMIMIEIKIIVIMTLLVTYAHPPRGALHPSEPSTPGCRTSTVAPVHRRTPEPRHAVRLPASTLSFHALDTCLRARTARLIPE